MNQSPENPATELEAAQRHRHPLARGIELLTLMVDSDQDSHGVRELAGKLDVSPSTAHRLIRELEKLGLVARTPSGTYGLGVELLRLSWTTAHRYPWYELATSILRGLTERSGESSFFGTYNDQRRQMMFSVTVESPHPLRYALPLNSWLPLHAGASGLSILAFLPESIRAEIAHSPLAAQTERTVIDPAPLMQRLDRIREDGYAITHGERIQGAIAIAAPVFGLGGVIGTTGITIPESRFNAAQTSALAAMVKETAEALSGQLTSLRVSSSPRVGTVS